VLATSRQALGVAGEVRMLVPPLSLPEEGDEVSVERLLRCDAVWLLIERAAAVVPGFAVDTGNAAAVLALCRRLDGIPLALELAAVRLGSLSLAQLNRGVAKELSILGSGNRGGEARQQTLEATIGCSHGLLSDEERLLWARLSVFAGGFEEDAVIAVCCDERLPADQIVDLLVALVEKSILTCDTSDPDPRYWLLETLRHYGRMRLREFGEEAVTQKRHLEWIRALAKSIGAWDSRQTELFKRMSDERDNLWAALDFCLRHTGEVEAAAELAQHLMAYWACRGPFGDVRRVLTSLADSAPENSTARARLLWVAAVMATSQNDYDACAALAGESLRIGAELKDVEVVAWSLLSEAMYRWVNGDLAGAAEQAESMQSVAQIMRLEQAELDATIVLCGISIARGELGRAIELGEQGMAMSKSRGELWVRGYLLDFLSQATWLRGDKRGAEVQAREGIACKHAVDDRNGLGVLLETLAWMAAECHEHERAATLLGCAERVRAASSVTLNELFRPQHEQSASIAVQGIGKQAFDAAFARGRAMTIDEGVAFAVKDEHSPKPVATVKAQPHAPLTRRESEIARLIADNLANRQIATKLFLSERTVETHVTNILNKLGLNSRIQLSHWVSEVSEPS
jgi:predicted ATPase/DNA-binding CsgD family transcriptional regulator